MNPLRMTSRTIACAISALLAFPVGGAWAQDRNDHDRKDAHNQPDRHDQQNGEAQREYRQRGQQPRGAGPRHDIYAGGHLSRQDHQKQYVVSDWKSRHLSPPPRGYHWVQSGDDFVLAAVAGGLIASIILHN